jgi:hypothetical protein
LSKHDCDDPYRHIRREIPPPGYPIKSKNEYNKKKEHRVIEKGLRDYYYEDEEDLKPFWDE